MEKECTAFHLRESKNIFVCFYSFLSPHGTRHSYCSSPRAPGCPLLLSSGSGLLQGGSSQAQEPGASQIQRPGGAKKLPWELSALPGAALWARHPVPDPGASVPSLLLRDSEMPRDDFPIASSRTAKHVLGRDTHVGEAVGAGGGHSRGVLVWGDTAGGVHGGRIPPAPPLPCVAAPWAGSLPPSPEPSRQPLGWSQNALFPSSCR